jgi:hypothetical protein
MAQTRTVLHVADLHIRTGVSGRARRPEYLEVIDNLVALAKTLERPLTTVIAGDVLHDRTALDPHAVHVFRAVMTGLADVGPVVVIQGNHDHHPMHDCPYAPHDVLGELLSLAGVPGVTYLDKTGGVLVGGVNFATVTVHDSVPQGEARSSTPAPVRRFPEPIAGVVNVAVFHGAIQGSKNDSGAGHDAGSTGVPQAWFAGYDAVMLGDQHVQQIGNHVPDQAAGVMRLATDLAKPTWAYPGSLLQQNHGESLWNHGAIVWDLQARTVTPVHVRNPMGFVTLKGDRIHYDGEWQDAAAQVADPDFPSTVEARCRGDADAAIAVLEAAGVSVVRTRKADGRARESSARGETRELDRCVDWRACVREHIDVDAAVSAAIIPAMSEPGLAALAASRNGKLERLARESKSGGPASAAKLAPLRLAWGSLLCYGEGNDVSLFADDGVVLVSAPNGAGKTAFLEVLLLALFGEGFPSRSAKESSAAIINVRAEEGHARLDFQLDGVDYSVARRWARMPKDRARATCKVADLTGPGGQVLCKGRVAVDDWIKANVCTAADFLGGPMLSQAGDNDALALSGRDMAAVLERAYGLAGVDSLGELLAEATNALKQVVARADAMLNGVSPDAFYRAQSDFADAKARSEELKARMAALPNPPAPKNKHVNAARALIAESDDAAEYDQWQHNKDAAALAALEELSFPDAELGCAGGAKMPHATVSALWLRYRQVCLDLGRHGFTHAELLARPELVKQLHADAAQDIDYGAELDRAAVQAVKLSAHERADRAALQDARSDLRLAETARSDALAISLEEGWATASSLWLEADEGARLALMLGYVTSAAGQHGPDMALLTENVMLSLPVVNAQTFDAAAAVLGLRAPKAVGARSLLTVQECAAKLAEAEGRLRATLRAKAELEDCSRALQKALRDQVLSKPDEDSADALRAFENAWAPLKGVDVAEAAASAAASASELRARLVEHEGRKALARARAVVEDHRAVKERARISEEMDALQMEKKAMEFGRVRGCEAVLKDYDAVQVCRARLLAVSQAAAKLKGVKHWLYSERIAPEVAAKVNAVVGRVSPGLAVECSVEDGAVLWTVVDHDRRVSPARASGFQRFMISVALRVVFGGMLAPCSVFVIDEGFTACDQTHLARVPEFLEWLVTSGHASTVILVSHLSEIREHVSKVVDLVRGAPFVA